MEKCTFIQIFYHYYLYSFFSIHITLKMPTDWRRHSDLYVESHVNKNTYFIKTLICFSFFCVSVSLDVNQTRMYQVAIQNRFQG